MKRPIPQRLVTIAILAVCILLNVLLQRGTLRADFSNGRAYSISPASIKVVTSLKKPVIITFYASENIPSELKSTRQNVDDFLKEYANLNKNIRYSLKDPSKDNKALKETEAFNIPPLQFSQQAQDSFALQTAYFGIGMMYDNKRAAIPQATNISDLEYNLTTALYKMSVSALPRIGIMGLDGGASQLQALTLATQSQFALEDTTTPTSDLKTLLVFGSTIKEYSLEEISALREYLQNGGSALFFIDGVTVEESLEAVDPTHNLFDLLKSFGVDLQKNLVLSRSAELISFAPNQEDQTAQTLPTVIPYPYWLRTNEYAKSSVFSNVDTLVFPWTSSVKTSSPAKTLVSTEVQTWAQTGNFQLNPQAVTIPQSIKEQALPLIAEVSVGKGRIIVVPSSKFILDSFLSRTSDNLELVINFLSEYAAGGALSGIRRRSVEYYALPQMSDNLRNTLKYSQIIGAPVLFSLIGLVWLIRRSKDR